MQTRNSFYLRYSKACDLSFEFGEKNGVFKVWPKIKTCAPTWPPCICFMIKQAVSTGRSVRYLLFQCLPSYSKLCLFLCFSSLIKVQRRMKNPWRSSNGFWRVSQATLSLDLAISEKYERILNVSFLFTYSRLNKAVSY